MANLFASGLRPIHRSYPTGYALTVSCERQLREHPKYEAKAVNVVHQDTDTRMANTQGALVAHHRAR